MQRRRKGAVEPERATVGAHRVVDEVEPLLHRRDSVRQYVGRHTRLGMGDGGEQGAVVEVEHGTNLFHFVSLWLFNTGVGVPHARRLLVISQ